MTKPTEAMLKAARGWADGAEAKRLRRNPGPTPHEEACFAAGMAHAASLIEARTRQTSSSGYSFYVWLDGKWTLTIWNHEPECLKLYADDECSLDEGGIDGLIQHLKLAKDEIRAQHNLRLHRELSGKK